MRQQPPDLAAGTVLWAGLGFVQDIGPQPLRLSALYPLRPGLLQCCPRQLRLITGSGKFMNNSLNDLRLWYFLYLWYIMYVLYRICIVSLIIVFLRIKIYWYINFYILFIFCFVFFPSKIFSNIFNNFMMYFNFNSYTFLLHFYSFICFSKQNKNTFYREKHYYLI